MSRNCRLWKVPAALLSAAVCLLCAAPARAVVKPNPLFTNGAVLQQGMPLPVFGTAGDGEKVTVTLNGRTAAATAQNGHWRVTLPPQKAGGPFTLTIAGPGSTVTVQNVLIGEVYVCSGQSNMEYALFSASTGTEAVAQSADPMMHLFKARHAPSDTPLTETAGQWQEAGPATTRSFSAVAYFFGRDLRKALHVPVGLIQSEWPGTPAEAWTSEHTLQSNPALRSILTDYAQAKADFPAKLKAYQDAVASAPQASLPVVSIPPPASTGPKPPLLRPPHDPHDQNAPGVLYNGMIAPLIPYGIRGVIWYQGESNTGQAAQYATLFPAMIANWRADWGEGEFPFLFVQLARLGYGAPDPRPLDGKLNDWPNLREAQRVTSLTVPHTAMVVVADVSDGNLHPKNKEPFGQRLALAALATVYGQPVEGSGPVFSSMQVQGDKVVLHFTHLGGGLVAQPEGPLSGFTVAGANRKYVPAQALIDGDTVVVSSPQVPQPVAVRYGWNKMAVISLFNKAGLPASPFGTDPFPPKP